MTDPVAQPTSSLEPTGPAHPRATANEARVRLAETFRRGELIWLVEESYDSALGFWRFDVLRQSNFGKWVQQRYRFDEAADVLYFLGEQMLSDDAFRAARAKGSIFPTS